jgi:ribosome biogenesis GTPase / thiamine phosphate phosphatase
MAQNTWTKKRRDKRKREEQDRHDSQESSRRSEMLRSGLEDLDREEAQYKIDENLARSRRVKSGRQLDDKVASTESGTVVGYRRNRFRILLDSGKTINAISRSTTKSPHHDATLVAVGDRVECLQHAKNEAVIVEVQERQNRLCRASKVHRDIEQVLVSNVTQIIIVSSIVDPYLKPGLIDRYLLTAGWHHIKAVICLNKSDLDPEQTWKSTAELYRNIGYEVIATSITNRDGLDELQETLHDSTSVLTGQSGVGKSSLLNAIDPDLDLAVASVMSNTRKGRHTTTSSRLIQLSFGGFVADTPGIKELTLWGIPTDDIHRLYPEFVIHSEDCYFSNCTHIHEPDCAVIEAVESGGISAIRYKNYLQICETMDSQ